MLGLQCWNLNCWCVIIYSIAELALASDLCFSFWLPCSPWRGSTCGCRGRLPSAMWSSSSGGRWSWTLPVRWAPVSFRNVTGSSINYILIKSVCYSGSHRLGMRLQCFPSILIVMSAPGCHTDGIFRHVPSLINKQAGGVFQGPSAVFHDVGRQTGQRSRQAWNLLLPMGSAECRAHGANRMLWPRCPGLHWNDRGVAYQ